MKTQEKPKEFPINPPLPEIEPGIDIPTPDIQPEFPNEPIPKENPIITPKPEIEPSKDTLK